MKDGTLLNINANSTVVKQIFQLVKLYHNLGNNANASQDMIGMLNNKNVVLKTRRFVNVVSIRSGIQLNKSVKKEIIIVYL